MCHKNSDKSGEKLMEQSMKIVVFWVILILPVVLMIILLFVIRSSEKQEDLISKIAKEEGLKEAAEKERQRDIENKIFSIESAFKPDTILFPFNKPQSCYPIQFDSIYINTEFNKTVREYKSSLQPIIDECRKIDEEIHDILSCKHLSSNDEKFSYLNQMEERLKKLKSQSDLLHSKINGKRIELLNKDERIFIQNAFYTSKDCNTKVGTLISRTVPAELNMFQYKSDPLILSLYGYYYCIFSNVILVFDKDGVYIDALIPLILQLSVTRKIERIDNKGNDWFYKNYNRRAYPSYRTSPYTVPKDIFGMVCFCLSEKICFTVSREEFIAWKDAKDRMMTTVVPDFLNLIQILNPKDDVIDSISKKYQLMVFESQQTKKICQITCNHNYSSSPPTKTAFDDIFDIFHARN